MTTKKAAAKAKPIKPAEKATKGTHGGKREGSGREKLGKARIIVSLSQQALDQLDKMAAGSTRGDVIEEMLAQARRSTAKRIK